MEQATKIPQHWSFWIIVVFALLWNLMGVLNYVMQINPETLANMPEAHRALAEVRPFWATAAFGVSVFGGSVGCILLMLRQPAANLAFGLSLIGVVLTTYHAGTVEVFVSQISVAEVFLTLVMPVVLAVFLVWYARRQVHGN